jgi:preprotein translocase subunit YajC
VTWESVSAFLPLILLAVLFFGVMYFFMVRPQRRRQREHSELIEGLKRGDRVITAGGIYGEIDYIDEETVVLNLEGGGKLRVLKHSIVRKQGEGE